FRLPFPVAIKEAAVTHTHPQPPAIWGRAWFGFFAPPSAYTVQLLFGYTLIPAACAGNRIPLITLSTLAFVVAVAAVIVSWGEWRTLTRKGEAMAFLALLGGVM